MSPSPVISPKNLQQLTWLNLLSSKLSKLIFILPYFQLVCKVNTDGAVTKNPSKAACGGMFWNSFGFTLGCFAQNLLIDYAFIAELTSAFIAIELAYQNNWLNLWLETDSKLTAMAFKNAASVPWELRNRWINCQEMIRHMNFLVTHIYREGNTCADSLANLGLNVSTFVWWQDAPNIVRRDVISNMLGIPNFRFVTFWVGLGYIPPFFSCIPLLFNIFG